MPIFTDQMQQKLQIDAPPQRIISLVPSQTELLFDLGLDRELVGITKFCVHPAEKCRLKTKIGGTKNFNITLIDSLKPDLIIGNKEENYQEGIELLSQKYPVWMSDIKTLEQALAMIQSLGAISDKSEQAKRLGECIKIEFDALSQINFPQRRIAYFIWRKPYMVAGEGTFIDHLLGICGLENVFKGQKPYPEVSRDDLQAAQPEIIFLSSEPFPFQQKHLVEFAEICPQSQIRLVDGEMFSWFGSRLQFSAAYFKKILEEIHATY